MNNLLLRPRVFYDANSSGGGGGSNNGSNGDGGNGQGQQLEDLFKVLERYPQEAKDKVFGARATQARNSAITDLLKELGVESAESLKAVITKAKEADDAQKSELQKALDKATTAEKVLADQKTAHDTALAELEKRIQDSEIKIAAGREVKDKDGKVIRPKFREDALDVVLTTLDRKAIVLKDGAYNGIEEALTELATAKTFLLEAEPTTTTKGSPTDNKFRKPNKPKSNTEDDEKPFFQTL
jgi:hypothetical protein